MQSLSGRALQCNPWRTEPHNVARVGQSQASNSTCAQWWVKQGIVPSSQTHSVTSEKHKGERESTEWWKREHLAVSFTCLSTQAFWTTTYVCPHKPVELPLMYVHTSLLNYHYTQKQACCTTTTHRQAGVLNYHLSQTETCPLDYT